MLGRTSGFRAIDDLPRACTEMRQILIKFENSRLGLMESFYENASSLTPPCPEMSDKLLSNQSCECNSSKGLY